MWFLDSAYKTTQAMKDFNREELSLMIFGNKRGFSGGNEGYGNLSVVDFFIICYILQVYVYCIACTFYSTLD